MTDYTKLYEGLAQLVIDTQKREALNKRMAADIEPMGCLGVIAMIVMLLLAFI